MLKKRYSRDRSTCAVTFSLKREEADGAESVRLVGDFNGWNVEASPMKRGKIGGFEITVTLERGRDFCFRYLVDEARWINDWNADKYVPILFCDGENGVVIV